MTAEVWEQVAAFIEARVAEDEQTALAATSGGPWRMDGMEIWGIDRGRDILVVKHTWPQEAVHILRHDPAAALRRVAADRKLLEHVRKMRHRQTEEFPVYGDCRSLFQRGELGDLEVGFCDCGVERARMAILTPLMSVWSEHPGYPAATP